MLHPLSFRDGKVVASIDPKTVTSVVLDDNGMIYVNRTDGNLCLGQESATVTVLTVTESINQMLRAQAKGFE